MRVVYVTPGHTPLDIRILSDLHSLQNAVDGLIEPIYSEPEGIVLVGNDEAKLRNMKSQPFVLCHILSVYALFPLPHTQHSKPPCLPR